MRPMTRLSFAWAWLSETWAISWAITVAMPASIAGERENPGVDADLAAGQGEGVRVLFVEDDDLPRVGIGWRDDRRELVDDTLGLGVVAGVGRDRVALLVVPEHPSPPGH